MKMSTHKKRIIYVASSPGLSIQQSGGAGTHIRGTIKGLRELGHEVLPLIGGDLSNDLSANSHNSLHGKSNAFRKIIKQSIPNSLRLMLRDLRTFIQDYHFLKVTNKMIREFAPDVIYERSCLMSKVGSRLARKFQLLHFIESDGCMVEILDNDYGVFSVKLANLLERQKLNDANYVVALNKASLEAIGKKFNVGYEKLITKTLGSDPNDLKFTLEEIESLRTTYNLSNKFVVGFIGSISAYHGVSYLIDAAIWLMRSGIKDVIIVIVGWSKEGEALKTRAEASGIDNIVFLGAIDKEKIGNYYKLFDVGVIPDSEKTIYPIKLLEYGISQVAPLVPDYPIFRELLIEGTTGYFFQARNSISLANAIILISQNRPNCKQCADNWRRRVLDTYTWRNTMNEIQNVILKEHFSRT